MTAPVVQFFDPDGRSAKELAGWQRRGLTPDTDTPGGAGSTSSGAVVGEVTRCLFAGGGVLTVAIEDADWPAAVDTALASLGAGAAAHAWDVWIDLSGMATGYLHGPVVEGAPAGKAIALRYWDGSAWSALGASGDVLLPCDVAEAVLGAFTTLAAGARTLVLTRPFALA